MSIFHTIVYPGEDSSQAIIRAAFEASRNGFNGYSVDCEKCGRPVDDHETVQDCEIWQREFGKSKSLTHFIEDTFPAKRYAQNNSGVGRDSDSNKPASEYHDGRIPVFPSLEADDEVAFQRAFHNSRRAGWTTSRNLKKSI